MLQYSDYLHKGIVHVCEKAAYGVIASRLAIMEQ